MQSVNAIQDFQARAVKSLVIMCVLEITHSVVLRILMVLSHMAVTLTVNATI